MKVAQLLFNSRERGRQTSLPFAPDETRGHICFFLPLSLPLHLHSVNPSPALFLFFLLSSFVLCVGRCKSCLWRCLLLFLLLLRSFTFLSLKRHKS